MERTVLITGATDGLGKGLAFELAARGHHVLVHGRNPERVRDVVEAIGGALQGDGSGTKPAGGSATGYVADLSSLAEVRRLADEVLRQEAGLCALVNNAGTASRERCVTVDGYEQTFAVNYLSHFLLTRRLLPLLERATPSRIVNVSSIGQAPIAFDDVMLEKKYTGVRAYMQSKLAQIMFTFQLAEQLPVGVTVNAIHPASLMDTKMVREVFGRALSTVQEGVAATVRLVTASDLDTVNGRYFDRLVEARAEKQAYDREACKRLWTLSEQLTGLS